jgi:hypothetical protein
MMKKATKGAGKKLGAQMSKKASQDPARKGVMRDTKRMASRGR